MPIKEGDTFPTLQDFKDGLRRWAISENWTPHIHDSDRNRVRAGCRSAPDCPFRIRANYNVSRANALVTTCDGEHTCFGQRDNENPLHQNIKRSETGKLKFLLEAVPKLLSVTLDTHVQEIVDAVERKYGQKIPVRQAQKVKNGLTPRVLGPCRQCRQTGHTRRHCPHLRAPPPERTAGLPAPVSPNSPVVDPISDEGTYADGGLEDGFEEAPDAGPSSPPNPALNRPAMVQQAPRGHSVSGAFAIDTGVRSGAVNGSSGQRSIPDAVTQPALTAPTNPRSATQIRTEAYKLMQEAADHMKQAADLNKRAATQTDEAADKNSKAAQMLASVADQ